ncbi:hypothetical protein [Pseudonocardia pini]|uniref:hypothetical protein n=1 Tax=Pseudonocardia pini TaxID=2758030 RepID=UPI0015F08583|nr:hypothetical protein [Pseudonocardia pini]
MSSVEVLRTVPGWPVAFRGSAARSAGLVTGAELRGPRFTRPFPDVYVQLAAAAGLSEAEVRIRAAAALVDGRGVLSGYSAALLHGADCGPLDAPAEATLTRGGIRPRPGLVLHRDLLRRDEIEVVRRGGSVAGLWVTTARRTAFDLARWAPSRVERIVALDALANAGGFDPAEVLALRDRHPGARGTGALPEIVSAADRYAGSPPETRVRLALVAAGLPRPKVQWVVQDPVARRALWLDMAYPEHLVGLEYEGAAHTRPEQVLRDTARFTTLTAMGWRMLRFTKWDPPERIAGLVRAAISTSAVRP